MTTRPNMHVGDYGTTIELTVVSKATNKALPLGGLLEMHMLFQKPSGATFTKEAEMVTPPLGTDGKLKYVIEDGDIDESGQWKVQGSVISDAGEWHTDIETFEVGENIVIEEEG